MFDTYLMVDWSAAASPADWPPGADSIWWAAVQDRWKGKKRILPPSETIVAHERTRSSAIAHLTDFLQKEIDRQRRVLIGFDFAFGYPSGFAREITGKGFALEMWKWLSDQVVDDDQNRNNRFSVAGDLNKMLIRDSVESGPFWGYPEKKGRLNPGVPTFDPYKKGAADWTKCFGFNHLRATDRAPGAKSLWHLFGNGTVGSQVLLGLPALWRLCQNLFPSRKSSAKSSPIGAQCVVWPISVAWPRREGSFQAPQMNPDGAQIVIVEIYPSLLRSAVAQYKEEWEILDRAQVRLNALAFSLLGEQNGGLEALFTGPKGEHLERARGEKETLEDARTRIATEEGWMFGYGYEKELSCVLKRHFQAQARRHQAEDGVQSR